MGDRKNTILQEKPILQDLESLYQGIPDESVNLTFGDLADVNVNTNSIITTEPVSHVSNNNNNLTRVTLSPSQRSLGKIPSLDFSKGLQASIQHNHHNQQHLGYGGYGDSPWGHFGHHNVEGNRGNSVRDPQFSHASGGAKSSPRSGRYSVSYDDMSVASGTKGGDGDGGSRRRRPGIPHSKICSICSTYVYFFRTRCLVCGRSYCCRCVKLGMGEMVEGRKCIECLGLKFSQRYIERAGKVSCCNWRYPSTLKQVELICAEKGPRKSGRSYGHSGINPTSSSRNPITPRTPPHAIGSSNSEHSFIMSSSFSPFSPHHNNLPF